MAIALGRGRLAVCGGDGNRGDVGDGREPSFVINRYRTATIALNYYGDSVANSWGDILSCAIGFVAARYLGLWVSIAVFVLIEVARMFWIRDSLLLNVLMLIHPLDAVKAWQSAH